MNVLDARNGTVIWSRNASTDTDTKIPIWGFSSSPLIVDSVVVVAVASSVIAYHINTGEPCWSRKVGTDGYSSPQLLNIKGNSQVVMLDETGAISIDPVTGELVWAYSWSGFPIIQPAMTNDGDLLLTASERSGIRRLSVSRNGDGWSFRERWTTEWLKPCFNDFVIHKDHIYGLSGRTLACIGLEKGERKWKGGRYGGQILSLADQGILLILSEKGDLALVEATPSQFKEIARFRAIKGKTWNHPVLVGDVLLVRNSQEMAAFRLKLAAR